MLETHADGSLVACFDGRSVGLGKFSARAVDSAQHLRTGLPLRSFASDGRKIDKEIDLLVRRLARRGLLEYRLGHSREDKDQVVIEPQAPDYWPQTPKLGDADIIVLSRFACLRRRGNEMVLESPRAGALFKICDPKIATAIAVLSTPQKIKQLRRQDNFPGVELLLFHTRSTEGRHANPIGGLYPYAGTISPPPAVRSRWPGKKIDLRKLSSAPSQTNSPVAKLLRERHSTRGFDDRQPITLAELSRFLDSTARVRSKGRSRVDLGDGGPEVTYAARPYPSGGSAYELELYLAVANCEGLASGFYHYDADRHALVPIAVQTHELEAQLAAAEFAMDAPAPPQILITIAARFGRISWKYSSIAYALILKDVGVLIQTLYMMATDMGLGGCAIGTTNIDLFAKMTGIEFHVEGPVGQFAIGRGKSREPTDEQPDGPGAA